MLAVVEEVGDAVAVLELVLSLEDVLAELLVPVLDETEDDPVLEAVELLEVIVPIESLVTMIA